MKMKMIAAVVGTVVIANAYAQETYSIEAGALYATLSSDDKYEQKTTGVGGTYFLKPIVIDSTKPFAELDFLQKASGISVKYGTSKIESAEFLSTNVPQLNIGGTFYVDSFVISAYNTTFDKNFNLKAAPASYVGIKGETTAFSLGYFVLPNTVVSYLNDKETGKYSPSAGVPAIKDLTITTNGIQSHTVYSLGGTESIVLDLAYKQIKREKTLSDTNTEYGVKARYYPQNNFYVEGGYKSNTGDYAYNKGKTTLVGLGYSFTPRFVLTLIAENFSGDVSTEKSSGKSTTVQAGYRF